MKMLYQDNHHPAGEQHKSGHKSCHCLMQWAGWLHLGENTLEAALMMVDENWLMSSPLALARGYLLQSSYFSW